LEDDRKAKQIEAQRKADLERAKKAGRETPKGKSAPNVDSKAPTASWKQELEELWDQASA
jgi:hypothetical protein